MLDFLAFSSDVVPWESVLLALLLAYLLSQWIAGLYPWTDRGSPSSWPGSSPAC